MAKNPTPRVLAAKLLRKQLDFGTVYADKVSLEAIREFVGVKITQTTADKVVDHINKLSAPFQKRLTNLIERPKKEAPPALVKQAQAKKKKV